MPQPILWLNRNSAIHFSYLQIVGLPPLAMRSGRRCVLESRGLELGAALSHEASLAADAKRLEAVDGAGRFARAAGRYGGNS